MSPGTPDIGPLPFQKGGNAGECALS